MFKNIAIVTLALIAGEAEARRHHHHVAGVTFLGGIEPEDLMQEQPSHWRKVWPQGLTDAGDDDENVLNLKGEPRKFKEPPPVITYPWTLDSDIVDSQSHLEDV